MRRAVAAVLGLSVFMVVASCTSSYESRGDNAYSNSRSAQGDQKRLLQKTAYMMYKKALAERPNNISPRLRQRFLEMCLDRANMVISEGTAELDALPLFMEELDKYWIDGLPTDIKQGYASFLVKMADSSLAKGKVTRAFERLDKAAGIAENRAEIEQRKANITKDLVGQNLAMAQTAYQQGVEDKDEEQMVRAEYYARLCLVLEPSNQEAKALFDKVISGNVSTYSAYARVIDDIQDTVLYKRVNKYSIFLAVPGRNPANMSVSMYNYSNNPQRLKASSFYLVDEAGNKYVARESSKIDPEILDQEHETTKLRLVFPSPAKPIKKLVYEIGPYYAEKLFM